MNGTWNGYAYVRPWDKPRRGRRRKAPNVVRGFKRVRMLHPRAYQAWSYIEDVQLAHRWGTQGLPGNVLAVLHGRSMGAISSRLVKLGLVDWPNVNGVETGPTKID